MYVEIIPSFMDTKSERAIGQTTFPFNGRGE